MSLSDELKRPNFEFLPQNLRDQVRRELHLNVLAGHNVVFFRESWFTLDKGFSRRLLMKATAAWLQSEGLGTKYGHPGDPELCLQFIEAVFPEEKNSISKGEHIVPKEPKSNAIETRKRETMWEAWRVGGYRAHADTQLGALAKLARHERLDVPSLRQPEFLLVVALPQDQQPNTEHPDYCKGLTCPCGAMDWAFPRTGKATCQSCGRTWTKCGDRMELDVRSLTREQRQELNRHHF